MRFKGSNTLCKKLVDCQINMHWYIKPNVWPIVPSCNCIGGKPYVQITLHIHTHIPLDGSESWAQCQSSWHNHDIFERIGWQHQRLAFFRTQKWRLGCINKTQISHCFNQTHPLLLTRELQWWWQIQGSVPQILERYLQRHQWPNRRKTCAHAPTCTLP